MTDAKPSEEASKPLSEPAAPSSSPDGKHVENGESGAPTEAVDASAPADPGTIDEPGAEPSPKPKKKKKKKKAVGEDGKAAETGKDGEAAPLMLKGNPLRLLRGGVTAGVGALLAFLIMAHDAQMRWGVPLGTLFLATATWGVLDLLGTFDDPEDRVAASTTVGALATPIAETLGSFLLFCGSLAGASSGLWSQGLWAVVVTLAFLALVVSVFELGVKLGPWAKDELGLARPLLKRHGFWVVVVAAVLYLPVLGNYALWDPWETHYGEVAREILSRDDWISLWWAQDGWFWSKPILDFWIQAVAMATLGVHYKPDQMLIGAGGAPVAHPEWAVRAPVFLMVVFAMYLLYKGVAKVFGRRAGLLGALVLATMSDWYFLAHQTMTDMPFVAAMTAAMGLLLLGLHSEEETNVRVYEVEVGKTKWRLSGWHLVFGVIVLSALPQILYLLSRNIELVTQGSGAHGFRPRWDEFVSGSAGNCGLPGNEACTHTSPASIPQSVRTTVEGFGPTIWRAVGAFEPFLQALLWAAVMGSVLYVSWGERRIRRLYYLAAWYCAAVATMAKGPAGFALPMICAFAYVCTTKRWKELLRFEIVSGVLIILAVAIPWYVAMYVRHGSPFTDRLIFHDMFNRAFHHVHDTNEGDDTSFRFYIWQLGYALFPWTGLVPLGLLYFLRRGDAAGHGKGDASVMLMMWFLFSFALFSFMGTKFHHYIFPAVPAAAMLLGVALDDVLGKGPLVNKRGLAVYLAGMASGTALTIAGAARFWPGSIFGTKPEHSDPSPASPGVGALLLVAGVGIAVLSAWMFRAKSKKDEVAESAYRGDDLVATAEHARVKVDEDRRAAHHQVMLSGAALAGALLLALVGRDLAIKPDNADQPGAIRLLHLFTYNYRRPWPDTLDFGAILAGFALVAVALSIALAVRALRKHVVVAFLGLGFVWALWGLDVYMVKTAPHWGQHEVIQAYYESRKGPDEPLVAYQMNWKGENFYTGNHVPAFVSSGATFTQWMKTQREKGVHVMFFITEHGRTGGLRSEVQAKNYREVTDKALDNKFVLVRAEL